MPELPEVEVVRAGLAPAVTGARVAAVDVLDERSLTRHDAASGDFESLLTGARIEREHVAALGAGLVHGLVEGGLGVRLEGGIEGESDVAAHRGEGIDLFVEEHPPACVAL